MVFDAGHYVAVLRLMSPWTWRSLTAASSPVAIPGAIKENYGTKFHVGSVNLWVDF